MPSTDRASAAVAAGMTAKYGDAVVVDYCMRYGNPSTASVIENLRDRGCEKIVFFPLYPQYSAATTAGNACLVCVGGQRFQHGQRRCRPQSDRNNGLGRRKLLRDSRGRTVLNSGRHLFGHRARRQR